MDKISNKMEKTKEVIEDTFSDVIANFNVEWEGN